MEGAVCPGTPPFGGCCPTTPVLDNKESSYSQQHVTFMWANMVSYSHHPPLGG